MPDNIQFESIEPALENGRHPVKILTGETCVVRADIFQHGEKKLEPTLKWRKQKSTWAALPMKDIYNDRWEAAFLLEKPGRYEFMIEAKNELGEKAKSNSYEIIADRKEAVTGAWYEFFIRSQGTTPGKAGTFKDAEKRLADIKNMGFNILYIAPIHPIGRSHRKGKNGSTVSTPEDPGSPWAIGNELGGHTAIDPLLGTMADFDHFIQTAQAMDMEIAMDLALQCSPDHPWVKQHPDWFYKKADGTIQHASNPPYEYEDVYPLNFDGDHSEDLWGEIKNILLFWVGHGVKIFRVDNPHSKPFAFWEWLIAEVQQEDPEVVFLAEAFTRPKIMKYLSKAGFSQTYTYFIWRSTKQELKEYLAELIAPELSQYFRPNFFITTHDVLPSILQKGGVAAFKMRLVLAATLSPSYGIYSGYELIENDPISGADEYNNSEKFEIKIRDWNKPGNIKEYIAQINRIRQENTAFGKLDNLTFLDTTNQNLLAYLKINADKTNILITVVNLDPHNSQEGHVDVPLTSIQVDGSGHYELINLLNGEAVSWGTHNFLKIDPEKNPAHIYRLVKRY